MSTVTAIRPGGARLQGPSKRLHRWCVMTGAMTCTALVGVLIVKGASYYALGSIDRVGSPLHAEWKPSGTIGHGLGVLGGVLLLLMYLYPLRKRWKWLSRQGTTKHWLDYHILMGLAAPVLVTFHSSFKLQGIAGIAYWIMVAVAASGVVGRYFYGSIPRRLDAVEMSLGEVEQLSADLAAQVEGQQVIPPAELRPLLELPSLEEVHEMPLLKAVGVILYLDLRRAWLLAQQRRKAGARVNAELSAALSAVRRHAALAKNALFLSKMHQLFHLWHVIHRPFSYSLAILATLHVMVAMILGYFWR